MKTCILVGTGNRMKEMFLKPILEKYSDSFRITAVYDVNIIRAKYFSTLIPYDVDIYDDTVFEKEKPDYWIVATNDNSHEEVICRTLSADSKVICEKPVCTTAEQCNKLMSLPPELRRNIVVTFNSRYMPVNIEINNIIKSGILGKIQSMSYSYFVDDKHGAEYFRRWHRYFANSNSLFIHKSVHHFDLINWWLNDTVLKVNANGSLRRFGGDRKKHGTSCRNCEYPCEYKITDDKNIEFENMYYKAENVDGYIRDRCVYDKDIDIYDTMSAHVTYFNGTELDYSLILYAAYTGFDLRIYGDKRQLNVNFNNQNKVNHIEIFDHNGNVEQKIEVKSVGDKKHNGSDEKLIEEILFENEKSELPSVEEGINAVYVGLLACESIKNNKTAYLKDMMKEW